MALVVNGKTIPTNKPYYAVINGKGVNLTVVTANGKVVWRYVNPVTPPPSGGTTPPPSGGHWAAVPYSNSNRIRTNRQGNGPYYWLREVKVGGRIVEGQSVHYPSEPLSGQWVVGGVKYTRGSHNHSSGGHTEYYGLMKWIP